MKLKSRKFWISIIVIAYGAIMGIRSLNLDDQIVTIVCLVAAAVAGVAYVIAEALVDSCYEIDNEEEALVDSSYEIDNEEEDK